MDLSDRLPAAEGEGAGLFTERVRFYLQHQALIEEWADLRREASRTAADFLLIVEEQIPDPPPGWFNWTGSERKYHCVMVTPLEHQLSDTPPPTGIALGWHESAVRPDVPGDRCPFVGVYLDREWTGAGVIRAALETAESSLSRVPQMNQSERWPRYRHVPAPSNWWRDLDRYRDQLIAAFEETTNVYQPVLDATAKQPGEV